MKLYVGNLPFNITEDELQAAFTAHGAVDSVTIIKDKWTQQSKGFGFVEMPTREEAQTAISTLNGSMLGGRPLRVDEARPPRTERRQGGQRRPN